MGASGLFYLSLRRRVYSSSALLCIRQLACCAGCDVLAAPFVTPALAGGLLCGLLGLSPPLDVVARACALAGGASIRVINTIASWWGALPFAVPSRRACDALMAPVFWAAPLLAANRAPYAVSLCGVSAVVALLSGMLALPSMGTDHGTGCLAERYKCRVAGGGQGAVIGEPESVSDAQNLAAF